MLTNKHIQKTDTTLYGIAELKKAPLVLQNIDEGIHPELNNEPIILRNDTDIVEVGTFGEYMSDESGEKINNQIHDLIDQGYHGFVYNKKYSMSFDAYFHNLPDKEYEPFKLESVLDYLRSSIVEKYIDLYDDKETRTNHQEKDFDALIGQINKVLSTTFTSDALSDYSKLNQSDLTDDYFKNLNPDKQFNFILVLNHWFKRLDVAYGGVTVIPYYYVRQIKSDQLFTSIERVETYAKTLNLDETAHVYTFKQID